jgi:hypothetical protein
MNLISSMGHSALCTVWSHAVMIMILWSLFFGLEIKNIPLLTL